MQTLRIAIVSLALAAPAFAQSDGGTEMHMDMNHMRMTSHPPAAPGDSARAAQVLATLRTALAPYQDYHKALADGYRIFFPKVPQPVYHFTNRAITRAGVKEFDPAHPGSLLYQKIDDSTYKLVGAMYIAAKDATPDELNARLPLSIATWHAHTNFCVPQNVFSKARWAMKDSTGQRLFGFKGSISTADACAAANGRFLPQVFGWMVHVYPFAPTWNEVWATDEVPASSNGMTGMPGMKMPATEAPHT
ncbi:MAG TPA: hypothetical protein VFA43_12595 [Gemmatimonadaceae bacterium]|nr:hypothetical protein [Gemmatimonadaceae bacterium]